MREFLARVADLSQLEAGNRFEGITQSDISRWERGDWEYLQGKKRRALKRALGEPLSLDPAPGERGTNQKAG